MRLFTEMTYFRDISKKLRLTRKTWGCDISCDSVGVNVVDGSVFLSTFCTVYIRNKRNFRKQWNNFDQWLFWNGWYFTTCWKNRKIYKYRRLNKIWYSFSTCEILRLQRWYRKSTGRCFRRLLQFSRIWTESRDPNQKRVEIFFGYKKNYRLEHGGGRWKLFDKRNFGDRRTNFSKQRNQSNHS